MNTTTYERAKAYEYVSQKVKDFFEGKQKMFSDVKQTLEYLFPELVESEDERIRKCLINGMKFCFKDNEEATWGTNGFKVKIKDILAWLEKQSDIGKRQSKLKDDEMRDSLIKAFKSVGGNHWGGLKVTNILNWLEKQGEPQPYKGDADAMRENLIAAFKSVGSNYWGGFDVRDILYWLESKDAIELEKQGETFTKKDVDDAYLKGICDAKRELEKQGESKWSEEDENRFNNLCNIINENEFWGHASKEGFINWLKSLKPQNHWKPTQEQLDALDEVCKGYYSTHVLRKGNNAYEKSISLYNELKRL